MLDAAELLRNDESDKRLEAEGMTQLEDIALEHEADRILFTHVDELRGNNLR